MTEPQTISAAVDILRAPEQVIKSSLAEFGRLLPAAVTRDTFAAWSLSMLAKGLQDAKQARAWSAVLDPSNAAGMASVMVALRQCAALGLMPGTEYHLVPYLSKDSGGAVTGATVTGITDYKGEVRLISNWEPCTVIAELVHASDKYHRTGANIPPKHDYDEFGDRGPIVGGYAYVDYGGGRYSLVHAMPRHSPATGEHAADADSFDKHQAVAKTQAMWSAWYPQMCRKTLVHGVRKLVPWSPVRQWEPK